MPRVLIIIVTWNKKEEVLRLLWALDGLSYPREAIDILMVDNDSRDKTAEAVQTAHPAVRVIRNGKNLGGSGGFNTGLRWALEQAAGVHDYLWLLDNDVQVHRDALSELVAVLEAHGEVGVAGSTMLQLERPWRVNEMGGFLNLKTGRLRLNRKGRCVKEFRDQALAQLFRAEVDACRHLASSGGIMRVDYVAAASLLVRWDAVRRAGLFRDYFLHFDDVEWCLRMARLGYLAVGCATSLIWHASNSSGNAVPDGVHYYNSRNLLDVLRDYAPDGRAVRRYRRRVMIKALCCAATGKPRLSRLLRRAISDFETSAFGELAQAGDP
jgi:GT2 family glycosyltransferase